MEDKYFISILIPEDIHINFYAFQYQPMVVMKITPELLTVSFTNVQAIHCEETQIEERHITR